MVQLYTVYHRNTIRYRIYLTQRREKEKSAPHNTKCRGAHYKKCLMIIKTNPVVTRTELCGSRVEQDLLQWGQAGNNLNPTMKEF